MVVLGLYRGNNSEERVMRYIRGRFDRFSGLLPYRRVCYSVYRRGPELGPDRAADIHHPGYHAEHRRHSGLEDQDPADRLQQHHTR